jgi:L,D-transpeptidase YcbB
MSRMHFMAVPLRASSHALVTIRRLSLGLIALTVPAAALAQSGPTPAGQTPASPVSAGQPPHAPVAEPWLAQPLASPAVQLPQAPSPAPRGTAVALEPIDLPPAIEQGVDMIYIDQELVPSAVQSASSPATMSTAAWSGGPIDLFMPVNPIYTDLRRGLVKYQQTWGSLPDLPIAAGPTLKTGSTGERVAALRARLGLAPANEFDAALAMKVKSFQSVHGLAADGIAATPSDPGGAAEICACGCRWRTAVAMGEGAQGRRNEGRGRKGRDCDPDDGGVHPLR